MHAHVRLALSVDALMPPILIILFFLVVAATAALAWALWRLELRAEEEKTR